MTDIWFALIVLCLSMYVVLDGYDLGIGIVMLFERDPAHRHELLEQVAVAWDGNETWLVLLGVSLWAGFPIVFGTLLPHAYLPLVVMLFGLIVRGVSVEMASQQSSPRWERAFGVASLVAALAQGVVLGTLTTHVTLREGVFAGTAFGSLSWFAVLSALTVASVYLALGHAYAKGRTTGHLRENSSRRGILSLLVAAPLVVVSLVAVNGTDAAMHLHDTRRAAWFMVLVLLASAAWGTALFALRKETHADAVPMPALAVGTVALLLAWLVARYPVVLPGFTPADTVSPDTTMTFLAIGIGLNMPPVLFYNWFAHHAFRVKGLPARPADAEHVRSV